jgi:hypothetical protein
MGVKPPTAHPYTGDGIADHAGRDRCQVCGLGRDWGAGAERHDMPDVPAEAAEVGARIVGEGR